MNQNQKLPLDVATIGIADVKLPGSQNYKNLIREAMAPYFLPNQHVNLIQVQSPCDLLDTPVDLKNSRAIEDRLRDAVSKLNSIGPDFILIPDSRLHDYVSAIRKQFPAAIILNPTYETIKVCMELGYNNVGIIGDLQVMENSDYRSLFELSEIHTIIPCKKSQESIEEALLVLKHTPSGTIHQDTFDELIAVTAELKKAKCDAVVVTNPVIAAFLKNNCPLPVIDTTSVLAKAAAQKASFLQQEKNDATQPKPMPISRL